MIKVNFQLSVANSKIKAETAANRNKGKYIKKPIRTQSRKINQTVLLTGKRQFSIVIGVKFAASSVMHDQSYCAYARFLDAWRSLLWIEFIGSKITLWTNMSFLRCKTSRRLGMGAVNNVSVSKSTTFLFKSWRGGEIAHRTLWRKFKCFCLIRTIYKLSGKSEPTKDRGYQSSPCRSINVASDSIMILQESN